MQHLIGVDLGSSDCKVVIMAADGNIVASHRQPYATRHPRPGWAEQDAVDWYNTACKTLRECLATSGVDPGRVDGIAIDGPAHNVALLDGTDNPVYPVIHWSDLRSIPQAERLERECGDYIYETTLSQANPSWTLTQLLWVRENVPSVWEQVRRILVTKDYVRYRLTGQYQTDVYDAIGTQLYDVPQGKWSDDLCEIVGYQANWLPEVVPAESISGGLLPEAARDCGLPAGIPVAVGSGDSVVEALGIGAVWPGQCIVKLGTAANVNLVTAQPLPSRQSITYRHIIPDAWFTITATNSGTATMRWFRDTFCRLEVLNAQSRGLSVYELIDALAEGAPAGAQGLLFHPYLNGERSPYWNPNLRGDFVGIGTQHNERHFARAILEGVAFSIRDCLAVVKELGQPINDIFLIGGGAKSTLWRQVIADVLGVPLLKPRTEDAALGSAMLAGVAVGLFADWEQAVNAAVKIDATLEPNPAFASLYDALFQVYRDVTRDMAAHSKKLVEISESQLERSQK